MLFILIMDILSILVQKASEDGYLQPLSSSPLRHCISLYADDTVLFLKPDAADINLVIDVTPHVMVFLITFIKVLIKNQIH
jgi:hypothetical protein